MTNRFPKGYHYDYLETGTWTHLFACSSCSIVVSYIHIYKCSALVFTHIPLSTCLRSLSYLFCLNYVWLDTIQMLFITFVFVVDIFNQRDTMLAIPCGELLVFRIMSALGIDITASYKKLTWFSVTGCCDDTLPYDTCTLYRLVVQHVVFYNILSSERYNIS